MLMYLIDQLLQHFELVFGEWSWANVFLSFDGGLNIMFDHLSYDWMSQSPLSKLLEVFE